MKTNYTKIFTTLILMLVLYSASNAQIFWGLGVRIQPNPSYAGDTLSISINTAVTNNYTLNVFNSKDSLLHSLAVHGGNTVLPAFTPGNYSYRLLSSRSYTLALGRFIVLTPRVNAFVSRAVSSLGDTISLKVFAPSSEQFTMNVYNADGSLNQTLTVQGGTTILPSFVPGVYSYQLINSNGYKVNTGGFTVLPPVVLAYVAPGISMEGDTLNIHVEAPASEVFTLTIYTSTDSLLHTLSVNGGITVLPSIGKGAYHYELTNAGGYKVNLGGFVVIPPMVLAYVNPGVAKEGDTLSLVIKAPASETFTLNVYTSGDSLVSTGSVNGGTTVLPAMSPGVYHYELVNSNGETVNIGGFTVLPLFVSTTVAPNPSYSGQGTLAINAPITDTFTLNIYDSSTALVYTQSVPGGSTTLPSLDAGIFYYHIVNAQGQIVFKGRLFIIK